MRKRRERRKRQWLWIPALLIVLLFLLLVNLRRNTGAPPITAPPVFVTVRPTPPVVSVAPGIQNETPPTSEERSKETQRKIQRAYAQLVQADSYRRVLTCFNPGGRSVRFTLVHLRNEAGKDFFRCDTENLSENHPEEAISDRTEITNAAGNWQIRKTPGSEEVAMLVTTKETPNTTIAAHAAFSTEADGTSSHDHNIFAESSFADQGQSFIRIIESNGTWSAEYVIDGAGNLVSALTTSGANLVSSESYQLNPSVDPELFEIPEEKIAVQTSDPNRASSFLWEKNGELNKDAGSK